MYLEIRKVQIEKTENINTVKNPTNPKHKQHKENLTMSILNISKESFKYPKSPNKSLSRRYNHI